MSATNQCLQCGATLKTYKDADHTVENIIEIQLGANGWNAHYFGPHAAGVYDLFGTTILPTPYTPAASSRTVFNALAERNPDCRILLGAAEMSEDSHD